MAYEINLKHEFMFVKKFFKNPRTIGSIYPSSKYLANKMIQPIQWDKVNTIVELGAGTGVFTKYINDWKETSCDALLFEIDDEMRDNLKAEFPQFKVFKDARYLSEILFENGLKGTDCIISGLPFAAFSKMDREIILNEVVRSLDQDGIFIAFQYSLKMKKVLEDRFSKVEISFEPRNLSPAFIYTCYK